MHCIVFWNFINKHMEVVGADYCNIFPVCVLSLTELKLDYLLEDILLRENLVASLCIRLNEIDHWMLVPFIEILQNIFLHVCDYWKFIA